MIEVYLEDEAGKLQRVGCVMGPLPPKLAKIFEFHLAKRPAEQFRRHLKIPIFRGRLDGRVKTVLVPASIEVVRQIRRFEEQADLEDRASS